MIREPCILGYGQGWGERGEEISKTIISYYPDYWTVVIGQIAVVRTHFTFVRNIQRSCSSTIRSRGGRPHFTRIPWKNAGILFAPRESKLLDMPTIDYITIIYDAGTNEELKNGPEAEKCPPISHHRSSPFIHAKHASSNSIHIIPSFLGHGMIDSYTIDLAVRYSIK